MDNPVSSSRGSQEHLRICIQYEVLDKKPIIESYKNFHKRVGNNVMNYTTFDYWYTKFSGEEFVKRRCQKENYDVDSKSNANWYAHSTTNRPAQIGPFSRNGYILKEFSTNCQNWSLAISSRPTYGMETFSSRQRSINRNSGLVSTLRDNKKHLQVCIQYEVLDKKPIFESYLNFRKRMGDGVMDFTEFEHWYKEFCSEDFDLKKCANHQPATFSQLPTDVLLKITTKLTHLERSIVRNVSKTLRSVIDARSVRIRVFDLIVENKMIVIEMDKYVIRFKQELSICRMYDDRNNFEMKGNHVKFAINFLKHIMRNPKLKIEWLAVTAASEPTSFRQCMKLLSDISKEMGSKFHVEKLQMNVLVPVSLTMMISLLKPKILKTIEMRCAANTSAGLPNLLKTEQFKDAFRVIVPKCEQLTTKQACELFTLPKFVFTLRWVSIRFLINLRNILAVSPTFEECEIFVERRVENHQIEKVFKDYDMFNGSYHCITFSQVKDCLICFEFRSGSIRVRTRS